MSERNEPTRTLVHEIEDETKNRNFNVTPDDVGFQVPGPGSLDVLLVIVEDTDEFGVRVETDDTRLIDANFDKLSTWSDELAHIDAFTNSNNFRVISVQDFPYRKHVTAEVKLFEMATFRWVRAVYTIGSEQDF